MVNIQKIKQIAKEKGIPLNVVCKRVGITPQALSRIIRDNSTTVETLERLCDAVGCSPCELFTTDTPSVSFTGSGNNTAVHGTVTIGDTRLAIETLREQLHVKDEQIMELIKRIK